jgi:hypothetical protein
MPAQLASQPNGWLHHQLSKFTTMLKGLPDFCSSLRCFPAPFAIPQAFFGNSGHHQPQPLPAGFAYWYFGRYTAAVHHCDPI